jgi:hypothetical protein
MHWVFIVARYLIAKLHHQNLKYYHYLPVIKALIGHEEMTIPEVTKQEAERQALVAQ